MPDSERLPVRDETLPFAGGRLLLRGVNGSGKSTAMNMLLPFLLEADARSIDAAGEQTGVLRSWMLADPEETQRTGYLWIEFARAGPEAPGGVRHHTVGCGIRANRSTDRVTPWWFSTPLRPRRDTVADLDLVTRFFIRLGLEFDWSTMVVEGEFLDTVIGIPGVRTEIVMLGSPGGGTSIELSRFIRPTTSSATPLPWPPNSDCAPSPSRSTTCERRSTESQPTATASSAASASGRTAG